MWGRSAGKPGKSMVRSLGHGKHQSKERLLIFMNLRNLIEKLKSLVGERKTKARDPEQVLSEEWKQWAKGESYFGNGRLF
jgi:hypothetical protein